MNRRTNTKPIASQIRAMHPVTYWVTRDMDGDRLSTHVDVWVERPERATYGITLEDERSMIRDQAGACAICRDPFDGDPRHRHVDHDHVTGRVRGVLDDKCNKMLGMARDKIATLEGAVRYLSRFL